MYKYLNYRNRIPYTVYSVQYTVYSTPCTVLTLPWFINQIKHKPKINLTGQFFSNLKKQVRKVVLETLKKC